VSIPLENLKLVLSSPRPRAPTTLTNYLAVAAHFLSWLGDRFPPDEMDLRRYFSRRREEGISDSSLSTYFFVLQKLYKANKWDWPLESGDRPEPGELGTTPGLTEEEVVQLIANSAQYSKCERFYLVIASIYGPRRVELARIKKRHIKDSTLYIDTAKKGEKRTHLIPDIILPLVEAYRPRENALSTLSAIFQRVCEKGLGEKRPGYGWHSFRRTLNTLLPGWLAKADKPLWYAGYFLRWSRRSTGATYIGTPMAGVYQRPEILSEDPFYIDREVFEVHGFLKPWVEEGIAVSGQVEGSLS